MAEQLISLRLPDRTEVKVVLIRLPDGTIVPRAEHEVTPKEQAQEVTR